MIPLRDQNPGISFPGITIAIVLYTIAIYVFVQAPGGDDGIARYAMIPCEVTSGDPLTIEELQTGECLSGSQPGAFPDKPVTFAIVASIFLHGGFAHLLGNMWSLWIFGNNVEDAFGKAKYLLFYLAAGIVAGLTSILLAPSSTIPIVGASGAIAGVMGVYLVIFPRSRISTWAVIVPLAVPAWVFLGIWFATQFWIASSTTNVAWEAHVGGFVFGLLVALVLRRRLIGRLAEQAFQFVR